MSRYIDAEKTELELWDHGVNMGGEYQGVWVRFRDIEEVFKNAPKADAVPVVRCGECKHRMIASSEEGTHYHYCAKHDHAIDTDWFCADGEEVTE